MWIKDTFNPQNLRASTMAWHVLTYTAKSKVSSPMENCFNQWKKFMKSKLKRALLNEVFGHIMNSVEKRIIADASHLTNCIAKGHFIDMRKDVSLLFDRSKHKKRRSTLLLFEKENRKTQDNNCCSWTQAIPLGDKLWLLLERFHDRVDDCTTIIVHVVSMKGFLWRDCPENVPPTCLTCPIFLNTKCPCVGIQRALLNVPPDIGDLTLSQWLSGQGIFKPEIFNNRLRIDKDPTIHLPEYMQCVAPQVRATSSQSTRPIQAVVTEADNLAEIKDVMSRMKNLSVTLQPKAHACFAQALHQFGRQLQRFELDALVAVTVQGRAQKSSIAHLHASGKEPARRASKLSSDSRKSAVGRRNDENEIEITADAAGSASSRKPAGTSKGIAIEDQWICGYCNRGVKNTADGVKQHCSGETHCRNVANWPEGKELAPFKCPRCATEMVNDAQLVRNHRKRCAVPASASRTWHCDACNKDMPGDSETVHAHNNSQEHQRMVRWAAEQHRDGPELAQVARNANASALKTPSDGKKRKRN